MGENESFPFDLVNQNRGHSGGLFSGEMSGLFLAISYQTGSREEKGTEKTNKAFLLFISVTQSCREQHACSACATLLTM